MVPDSAGIPALQPISVVPGAEAIPRAVAALEQGIRDGLHLGAQVYVSLAGRVVADAAIGQARPGVPLGPDTLMLWFSATKPVVAVAVARLWEQGRLDLDDPVAVHLPEFGQRGKEAVTLRQVLTHTGGFRSAVDLVWRPEPWDRAVARVCAAPLERGWIPGQRAAYHAVSGWYVLGELIQRLSGRPFAEYLREELLRPLGMADSWIGISDEEYRHLADRVCAMVNTAGREHQTASPESRRQMATLANPGAGGHGPVRDLGRFYEMLLGRGRGLAGRFLGAPTVEALVTRHRVGLLDETFKRRIDWGLGFLVDSRHYGDGPVPYGYGDHCSPRTFGHSGRQSSVAFADPESGLVVVAAMNGMPGERRHDARMRALLAALYADLGLAPG